MQELLEKSKTWRENRFLQDKKIALGMIDITQYYWLQAPKIDIN